MSMTTVMIEFFVLVFMALGVGLLEAKQKD
jgi:hypothetical protein